MLKRHPYLQGFDARPQPPSGGCVLKRALDKLKYGGLAPAAFRRLCVETVMVLLSQLKHSSQPPSGGCVLKQRVILEGLIGNIQPPSGGCVLKPLF